MGQAPHVVEDCMGFLQLYSDGSVYRSSDLPIHIPLVPNDLVLYKDFTYDVENNLLLRVYKPLTVTGNLPVVYYIHGGGFCFGSREWPACQNCCTRLASGLGAVVVSPDYRLAPEHRLPDAIDDVYESLVWMRDLAGAEDRCRDAAEWLDGCGVDFGSVFVLGDSSGGNIAHHLAVRMGNKLREVGPVRIRGYVLLGPFFGGVVRTKSEEGPPEAMLNLDILDSFWRLSLPPGETRDHPLANPFGLASLEFESLSLGPFLVIAAGNELLKDRAEEYVWRMKEMGKDVEYVVYEGKEHGFFTNEPYSEIGDRVVQAVEKFLRTTLESAK
ncbi:hypothetical protein MLD38_017630 [Melastoma candidum]|uniref:Uncharacterized protein n=1 Tax=Melastoma candidum TaxID=119954 RepID=A0ACB9QQP8_9MYRT|nr:hypothetical protein MLD38_017630 [Melastoma candidum]